MTLLLSERQRDDLHKAILSYLLSANLTAAHDALVKDLGIEEIDDRYNGLLEKKWTSVIRLQKKIMDLEHKVQILESNSPRPAESLWLPRSPRHSLAGHRAPVTAVAFHPVFTTLASASEDSTIKIWDSETGEFERTVKGHTKAVCGIDYNPTGTLLVSCSSDLSIKLWDTSCEYKNIKTLRGHDHSVSAVKFVVPGEHIISASRDKTLKLWHVPTGYCTRTFSGHSDWVRDVCPSDDGKYMLSASSDQSARIWEIHSGESKLQLAGHDHIVECVALANAASLPFLAEMAGIKFSPDLVFAATGSRDKTIKLWDPHGSLLKTLHGHDNWVRAVLFHPAGKHLLSASDDKSIRCWDLSQQARCIRIIEDSHSHFVTCLRWAPSNDEKPRYALASGSVDLLIKVWMP